jgi:ribonuclease HII
MFLLRRALRELEPEPDFVLTDGWPVRGVRFPHLSIRKGDAVTASVAAASIVAKVTRDRMMDRYHRRFPGYGFDSNRGYGTRRHWDALVELGPCPIHRRSFKGVADPKPLPGRAVADEELDAEATAALDEVAEELDARVLEGSGQEDE